MYRVEKESKASEVKISKAMFIRQNLADFSSEYKLGEKMGAGAFGVVWKCTHGITGQTRAVKIISKEDSEHVKTDIELVKKELEILRTLDHPNIVKLFEYYEDAKRFYLVTEYCEGGNLFDSISKAGRVAEPLAARIMRQVLSAVSYCHANNVVHRDLKPDNILLDSAGLSGIIKVIDFGTAQIFRPGANITGRSGTSQYVAPEVLKNSYNSKCDVWSAGVLLYELLSGRPPFQGKNDDEIVSNVVKGHYSMIGEPWTAISKEAKDLVKRLLIYNPDKRIAALDAVKDPWIVKATNSQKEFFEITMKALSVLDNLKRFKAATTIKKTTMTYIVSQLLNEAERSTVTTMYQRLDRDGDGKISKEEFVDGYGKLCKGISKEELGEIFTVIDMNKSGQIDYNEFLAAAISESVILTEKNIKEAFNVMDKDKNGTITLDEVKELYIPEKGLSDEVFKAIVKEADTNNDGKISFDEYRNTLLKLTIR
eukprot:TRINITY_DN5843_c0_g1_i14.p1 TRINITY_DN5843_c0_g1~~TRINITY_DN5843_c0_g1_i14.p1  ORF type:complete len:482 (-),score=166.20 TRINITY_DN5843_c0_g1_i14:125-1570(-)